MPQRTPQEMRVAPFDACIVCYQGDVDTALVIRGEGEAAAGALMALGVAEEEAMATIQVWAKEEHGCDLGMVPTRVLDWPLKVCQRCADRVGLRVGTKARVPVHQPPTHLNGE